MVPYSTAELPPGRARLLAEQSGQPELARADLAMVVGAPTDHRELLLDSRVGALVGIRWRGKPFPTNTAREVLGYALSLTPQSCLPAGIDERKVDLGEVEGPEDAVHSFGHLQALISVVPKYKVCTGTGWYFSEDTSKSVAALVGRLDGSLAALKGAVPWAAGALVGAADLVAAAKPFRRYLEGSRHRGKQHRREQQACCARPWEADGGRQRAPWHLQVL